MTPDKLAELCAVVSDGTIGRPEALLTAQAHALDALCNDLTRIAYRNWDNFAATERLLRLAFKAKFQSRATIETLGNLKNPPTVIARQANIAHGPQQVNNGEPTHTREVQSEQSKLLSKRMANGWTPRLRAGQSVLIHACKAWERSTGPRTPKGKTNVARNVWKGGRRSTLRMLARLLRAGGICILNCHDSILEFRLPHSLCKRRSRSPCAEAASRHNGAG